MLVPRLTAPIASALTRPTTIVSTTPIIIQPTSASTSGAARRAIARISARSAEMAGEVTRLSSLFAYAEGRENAIQDVVGRSCTSDGVDGPQGRVKIQQQHLVRNPERGRAARLIERG